MMETKAKASNKCSKPRCRNDAASRRAKFCTECFRTSASCANSKRKVFGGNTTTVRGKGVTNNRGNTTTGEKKRQAGKKSGGNTTTGQKKRQAGKKGGKRSALRRSAKMLLIVNPLARFDPFQRKDLGDPRRTDEAAREGSSRLERSRWPHRWPMPYHRLRRH